MAKRVQRKPGVREQQYTKLRKNILQTIRRAESKGYRFSDLPEIPTANVLRKTTGKAPSPSDIKELELLSKNLYSKSEALSFSGKVVSGTERRKEEFKYRSQKGARTKRQKILDLESTDSDFTANKRKSDAEAKERINQDTEFAKKVEQGTITYQNLLSMIDENIKFGRGWGGKYISKILNEEIDEYGFDTVMCTIGTAPEQFISSAQAIVNESERGLVEQSIDAFEMLIRGTIPDAEELKETAEAVDMDDYEDSWEGWE